MKLKKLDNVCDHRKTRCRIDFLSKQKISVKTILVFMIVMMCIFIVPCEQGDVKEKSSQARKISNKPAVILFEIPYSLSREKPSTESETINIENRKSPIFITLIPTRKEFSEEENKNVLATNVLKTPDDQAAFIYNQAIRQAEYQHTIMHGELDTPVRVLIKTNKKETECMFDEGSDICVVEETTSVATITATCEFGLSKFPERQECIGKLVVRQADYNRLEERQEEDDKKVKEKVKDKEKQEELTPLPSETTSHLEYETRYKTGLFLLPPSPFHSILIVKCQDDDLPEMEYSLKFYSTVKVRKHENSDPEKNTAMVGFDHHTRTNSKDFLYIEVANGDEKTQNCLKLKIISSNRLSNGHSIYDYINSTDSNYSNRYQLIKPKEKGEKEDSAANSHTNYFKSNMQIKLDVFKPNHLEANKKFSLRLKVIDKQKSSQVASYLLPEITKESILQHENNLYSKAQHIRFVYVVGAELIKDVKELELVIELEGVTTVLSSSAYRPPAESRFCFFRITAEDVQTLVVEKLTSSHISAKENEHLIFTIEAPYPMNEIMSKEGQSALDKIFLKKYPPEAFELTMTEYSAEHSAPDSENTCHFSKGCKFNLKILEDCSISECRIEYKVSFIKGPDDKMLLEIKDNHFKGSIDIDENQFYYIKKPLDEVTQLIVNTPNVIVYTIESQEKQLVCGYPKKYCHSQVVTSHQPILLKGQGGQGQQLNKNPQLQQQYSAIEETVVYLVVSGLDKTTFALEFINFGETFLLTNGEPFSYKLPEQDKEFEMEFNIPEFVYGEPYPNNISLSLIAPFNSLEMEVSQISREGNRKIINITKTLAGYIKIKKKDIVESQLKIILKKTPHYLDHSIHFTMVAETSDHKFRLDTAITRYETLDNYEFKTYIVAFQKNKNYLISFNVYDTSINDETNENEVNIGISIYNAASTKSYSEDDNMVYKEEIRESSYNLYLDEQLTRDESLCLDNDNQCELIIKVTSLMNHEVEMALTLLSNESIMELKDGIWEKYKVDQFLLNTHFFFIPTHATNPVKIFFKESHVPSANGVEGTSINGAHVTPTIAKKNKLSLTAVLFDFSPNPNPSQWPFPKTHSHEVDPEQGKNQNHEQEESIKKDPTLSYFRTKELVQINPNALKKCFPNCVVLLSIWKEDSKEMEKLREEESQLTKAIEVDKGNNKEEQKTKGDNKNVKNVNDDDEVEVEVDNKKSKNADKQNDVDDLFTDTTTISILATNNEIELPEKESIVLEMTEGEEQLVMVNLKHAFVEQKEFLTFFTNYLIGYANIYAKVYIPSSSKMPDENDYDILFNAIQTQVSFGEVLRILMESLDDFGVQDQEFDLGDIDGQQRDINVDNKENNNNNDDDEAEQAYQRQYVSEILNTKELYLVLLIKATEPTRMILQYTTAYKEITRLNIDSTISLSLESGEQKLFQFVPIQDEKIKFIRTQGYPLFYHFKCMETDYNNCLEKQTNTLDISTKITSEIFRREAAARSPNPNQGYYPNQQPVFSTNRLKEFATLADAEDSKFSQYEVLQRTQSENVQECQKCVIFIWVYALEPSELSIQLQSLNTEIGLKENEVMEDFLNPSEIHRYYLPRVQKETTTIIVDIVEGEVFVTVSDNLNYKENKSSIAAVQQGAKKALYFNVPALNRREATGSDSESTQNDFNSLFSNLHVTVAANKPMTHASYSIVYSSGSHEMFLKNGVIKKHFLFENQPTTFYYENPNPKSNSGGYKSYLTITVEGTYEEITKFLEGLETKMFSVQQVRSPNGGPSRPFRTELSSEKFNSGMHYTKSQQSLNKPTTLTLQIPPEANIEIEIISSETSMITIGISDGRMIFLPLNYEYPLYILPNEEVLLVIENLEEKHVEFVIKKCDQSNPFISYTNEVDEYMKDEYRYVDRIGSDNNIYRHHIKTKEKERGTLYVKVKAEKSKKSILLIKSQYVDLNSKMDTDPGNQGILSYELTGVREAQLTFTGLECGKECAKETKFYLIKGKSIQSIYSQMTCAGQEFFSYDGTKSLNDKEKTQTSSSMTSTAIDSIMSIGSYFIPPVVPLPIEIELLDFNEHITSNNQITFNLTIDRDHRFVTIKAVYLPTEEEVFYKPIEIKLLTNQINNISFKLIFYMLAILLGMGILLIMGIQKWSRRGYVHVGDEEVMIA